jgi:PAS domain S-box-containing protein
MSASDIALSKEMEAALRESEQRFRDYAEMASDWFWATGPEHEFTYFSEQIGAFGGDERQPIGKRRWEIADDFASEPEKWREHIATLERHEPFYDFVYSSRRPDGALDFVSISGKPVFDALGRFTGYRGVARDITKSKRAEADLRRGEAYLAEAQKLSRTGSWAYNRTAREITYWTDETYRMLGFDPAAGIPSLEAFLLRIHPEDRGKAGELLENPLREGKNNELEYRIVLPDGSIRHIHEIGHPVFDASGKLVESVGTVIDITERKRAEEERQAHLWFLESMDRVSRVIQGTNDLKEMMSDLLNEVLSIFGCDRAWLVYPCDPEAPSWRAQMEHTRPDWPGVFALGVDLPMDPEAASAFQIARGSSDPVRFGPGSERPVPPRHAERFGMQSVIAMAVRPKIDKPYLFGLHQCSHPRIWTAQEERLFRAIGRRLADALTMLLMLRDLRESQARLEAAQRVAQIGYWDRNFDADRVTWSDEAYRIFGLTPQEREITYAVLSELIHPEDRAMVGRELAEALRGGPRYDVEYRVIRPDGERRIVHSQGDLMKDAAGRPGRIFGTVQDITERKRAEDELRDAQMELAHVNRIAIMGQISASIAHEINQPVAAILISAETGLRWLSRAEPDTAEVREALTRIAKDAGRTGDIIARIRALTKRAVSQKDRLDLNEIILEVIALARSEIQRNGVSLRTQLAKSLPLVRGDRIQLQQVILNFFVNAMEAMSEVSEDSRELHISTEEDGADGVLLAVRDSGPGVPPESFERLFEAFYTTKSAGMGMGLSICRSIVEAHGGKIWARANAPKGAIFQFTLPCSGEG